MKRFILKKISILFVLSVLLILICLSILIFDFTTINDLQGYGILVLSLCIGVGFFGLLFDYILSLFIKNRITLNVLELIIVTLFLIWVWPR